MLICSSAIAPTLNALNVCCSAPSVGAALAAAHLRRPPHGVTELVRLPRARVSHAFRAGERGPTPLHPEGPPLGGPTSSASSTRRAANVFVRRLPCRGCACVYLCECVCLGGRVCVAAPCEPSRASHACGPPQQILGSRAGPCPASVVCVLAGQLPCFCFCFCGSRVVSVRSVRVALVSRVCLRTSQSTFVLTFPKLHMYALL